jgi:hypothetical protein
VFTILRFGTGKVSMHLYKVYNLHIYVHNVEVIVEEDLLPSHVNSEFSWDSSCKEIWYSVSSNFSL